FVACENSAGACQIALADHFDDMRGRSCIGWEYGLAERRIKPLVVSAFVGKSNVILRGLRGFGPGLFKQRQRLLELRVRPADEEPCLEIAHGDELGPNGCER